MVNENKITGEEAVKADACFLSGFRYDATYMMVISKFYVNRNIKIKDWRRVAETPLIQ
jgi:hypothetical protein